MTEAPPKTPAAPPRSLRRSSEGRFLLGICAGLGRQTGIDPVVFRVGFAVLLFGSGIGIFLYIAAFLLMKEPNGRPGWIEQWTRRDFDAETVMALLTAVFGFGLAINLTTVWLDTGTLVVGLLLAVSLLAAHSRGVDLLGLLRSMPERLNRRPAPGAYPPPPVYPPAPAAARPYQPGAPSQGVTRAFAQGTARPSTQEYVAPPFGPAASAAPGQAAAADRPDASGLRATDGPDAPEFRTEEPQTAESGEGAARAASPSAEPFAPRGPFQPSGPQRPRDAFPPRPPFPPGDAYQPLDPRRRAGAGYSPYDPVLYGRPVPRPRRPRRPPSFIGPITLLLAFIVGGIIVAVQARSSAGVSPAVVGGAVLVTIGAGLLVATWWGRGAGLVAAGTGVAFLLAFAMMVGGLPRNIGDYVWTPHTAAEANRPYEVALGEGRLDLSELRMTPGTSLTLNARVNLGELTVIVPSEARVEVHASNKVGDIQIDQSIRGGTDIRFDKVLEPETTTKGPVSTIVLNLRGGFGDMEVRRAA
ncbi:PspC domain-containing protein [Nonomuraea sp. SMC257]|uniref:PspC domain-containing protein n=1 Tax=Nonomuraea montanisoli TaxID=2741721 RepID=A0A7Y6M0B6_9ACTN|nr:PspC domain-containing protein [Nonomuraea montanisoli]NUW30363.1 PspC domain-containing protein [Nonomuraea montanisoli]